MDIKSIFYNQERFSIRTGWRILIFIVAFIAMGFVIQIFGKYLFSFVPLIDSKATRMLFVYIGLSGSTWGVLRFIDKRPFISVGISFQGNSGRELAQGTVIGFGMMSLIFVVEYSTGMVMVEFRNIQIIEFIKILSSSLFLYIVVGYGEELLFRGYIFQAFVEGTNKWVAMGLVSIFFGIAHGANPNVTVFSIVNIMLAGVWLSIAYFKTNGLWLPIGLHISWNFSQGFIYSFPVSGITSINEQIGIVKQFGPDWLTGGSFGPEGGALGTIVIIAGSAFIYFSPWFSASEKTWSFEKWFVEKQQQQQQLEVQNPIETI